MMMFLVVGGVAFLAWQMHKNGSLDLGSLGLGKKTETAGEEAVFEGDKEGNPPTLNEPVSSKTKQQLMSGITIPTLEIAPQIVEAMDFYAERVSEEIRTHAKENLGARDSLEIKGVTLLHHKIELLDIAFLNGQGSTEDVQGITSTVLTPPALKVFSGVILKVVRRMGIRLKENSQRLFELYEQAAESLDFESIQGDFPSGMEYGQRGFYGRRAYPGRVDYITNQQMRAQLPINPNAPGYMRPTTRRSMNTRIRGMPFASRFNRFQAM